MRPFLCMNSTHCNCVYHCWPYFSTGQDYQGKAAFFVQFVRWHILLHKKKYSCRRPITDQEEGIYDHSRSSNGQNLNSRWRRQAGCQTRAWLAESSRRSFSWSTLSKTKGWWRTFLSYHFFDITVTGRDLGVQCGQLVLVGGLLGGENCWQAGQRRVWEGVQLPRFLNDPFSVSEVDIFWFLRTRYLSTLIIPVCPASTDSLTNLAEVMKDFHFKFLDIIIT